MAFQSFKIINLKYNMFSLKKQNFFEPFPCSIFIEEETIWAYHLAADPSPWSSTNNLV